MKEKSADGKVRLYFKLDKKIQMNVYIYAGRDRNYATASLVDGNKQAE